MSDKTPSKSEAPGSTEAEDSPTAEVPRAPKTGKGPGVSGTQSTSAAIKKMSDVVSGKKDDNGDEDKDDKDSAAAAKKDVADEAKSATKSNSAADSKPVTESKPETGSKPSDAKSLEAEREDDTEAFPKVEDDTKGRFTERLSAAVPASLRSPKPAFKSTPGSSNGAGSEVRTGPKQAAGQTGNGTAGGRPMTAGEYARTTNPSPSTTAVIPTVKDQPRVSTGAPTGAAAAASAASGRQASLKLVRVDPWSVTKVTFALTVALMIVAVVAITILWIVLSFAGVWDRINSSVTTVLSDDANSFDITQYLGIGRIVGLTLVISAINVIITTAVATIGAYLYNLAAQLLGGVDITLAEED